jgi:hypothetical protein
LKTTTVDMSIPKAVAPPKAKPKPRVYSNEPSIDSINEQEVRVLVGKTYWVLKLTGELLIINGEHTFKASWTTDGRIYAHLYESMKPQEIVLQNILYIGSIREWMIANSKRKIPISWTKKETSM